MKEEKRSEIMQDALQYLDDEMIENVEKLRGGVRKEDVELYSNNHMEAENEINLSKIMKKNKKRTYWYKRIAIAASVTVFLMVGWIWNNMIAPSEDRFGMEEAVNESANYSDDFAAEQEAVEEGITIPSIQVNLKKDGKVADMLGLFIYQGRCYVQSAEHFEKDIDFLGEKLGTARGLIDEWTAEDGYVELAGTFTGDFYEIKGVAPEFMLGCVYEWEDSRMVDLYIHNNGITLYKGADVIEKYLHLKENYKEVSFLTDAELKDAWAVGTSADIETKALSQKHHELIDKFLDSYSEGEFVNADFNGGDDSNDHIYHLYFTLDSGVRLHFRLLGDGYVGLQGLYSVCVKVDEKIYNELIQILKDAS